MFGFATRALGFPNRNGCLNRFNRRQTAVDSDCMFRARLSGAMAAICALNLRRPGLAFWWRYPWSRLNRRAEHRVKIGVVVRSVHLMCFLCDALTRFSAAIAFTGALLPPALSENVRSARDVLRRARAHGTAVQDSVATGILHPCCILWS